MRRAVNFRDAHRHDRVAAIEIRRLGRLVLNENGNGTWKGILRESSRHQETATALPRIFAASRVSSTRPAAFTSLCNRFDNQRKP